MTKKAREDKVAYQPEVKADPEDKKKKAANAKSRKMLTMRFERDYTQLLKGLKYSEQAEVNKDQFNEMMNEMGFTTYQESDKAKV